MNYIEITEEVRKYTQSAVKKSRYEHSVRTAEMCGRICRFYGLNEEKGYLAGIGHDMCKDLDNEKMIEIAQKDGAPIIDFEKNKPSLLHGRAAAVTMKEKFGITDSEILEAVAYHTSGKVGMCDISKVLFIADKIEPNRPQVNEKYYDRLFKFSLDGMLYAVLKENYDYLSKKGFSVFPGTENLLDFYKEK